MVSVARAVFPLNKPPTKSRYRIARSHQNNEVLLLANTVLFPRTDLMLPGFLTDASRGDGDDNLVCYPSHDAKSPKPRTRFLPGCAPVHQYMKWWAANQAAPYHRA